jgi:hypothetical protein
VENTNEKQSNFFVLDDTMRFLYITLRNRRVPLVAIEFIHRGKKWRADTPEEAIQLRMRLEHEDEAADELFGTDETVRSESPWTPDVFWDFVHSVGTQQETVLEALLESGSVSSADLAKKLKLDNEVALGGVISGLSKQLKRFDLKPMDLYAVHTDWSNGERVRRFFIHKAFKLAAEETGWPDERSKRASSTKHNRK